MIPGIRNLPVASTTVASAGALTFLPIAAIFPFCTKTLPFSTVPLVTVRTVALRINKLSARRLISPVASQNRSPNLRIIGSLRCYLALGWGGLAGYPGPALRQRLAAILWKDGILCRLRRRTR